MPAFTATNYILTVRTGPLIAAARLELLPGGDTLLVCRRKIHRPREPLRIFTPVESGAAAGPPVLTVTRATGVWPAYDVRAGDEAGEVIGSLRRRGVGIPSREVWQIRPGGGATAELRSEALPATPGMPARAYTLTSGGLPAGFFRRRYSPLLVRLELDFSDDPGGRVDRRLSLAAAFLMALGADRL